MKYDRQKIGHVFTVENKDPQPAANADYFAVSVDMQGTMYGLLLTEDQFKTALHRATMNPEDLKVLLED